MRHNHTRKRDSTHTPHRPSRRMLIIAQVTGDTPFPAPPPHAQGCWGRATISRRRSISSDSSKKGVFTSQSKWSLSRDIGRISQARGIRRRPALSSCHHVFCPSPVSRYLPLSHRRRGGGRPGGTTTQLSPWVETARGHREPRHYTPFPQRSTESEA